MADKNRDAANKELKYYKSLMQGKFNRDMTREEESIWLACYEIVKSSKDTTAMLDKVRKLEEEIRDNACATCTQAHSHI